MDQKMVEMQGKLTAVNLELQRVKATSEHQAQEVSHLRRLLEREKRDKVALEAEVASARNAAVKPPGSSGGDTGAAGGLSSAERATLLEAQLEAAHDRVQAMSTESERLRDECERLRGALSDRGAPGAMSSELHYVREERVRLALELRQAKQTALAARSEASHAAQQVAAVDALRSSHAEESKRLIECRDECNRLAQERAKLVEEHSTLLEEAQAMAAEIDNGRASHAQLSEQKLALAERLNATEHTLTALREEIRQREDDFQVGVAGPPPRACLLRRARPRTARGHRPFAPRVLQPLHRLRRVG